MVIIYNILQGTRTSW